MRGDQFYRGTFEPGSGREPPLARPIFETSRALVNWRSYGKLAPKIGLRLRTQIHIITIYTWQVLKGCPQFFLGIYSRSRPPVLWLGSLLSCKTLSGGWVIAMAGLRGLYARNAMLSMPPMSSTVSSEATDADPTGVKNGAKFATSRIRRKTVGSPWAHATCKGWLYVFVCTVLAQSFGPIFRTSAREVLRSGLGWFRTWADFESSPRAS